MGYKIEYSPHENQRYPVKNRPSKKKHMGVALLAAIILCSLLPKVRSSVVSLLIPGDDTITKSAFQLMVERLRDGDPINDAVTAFCQEILNNDKPQNDLN